MKKLFLIVLSLLIAGVGFPSVGFSMEKPQSGGILRILDGQGGTVIGYFPEMGPNDGAMAMPGCENLLNINENREIECELAESYQVDDKNLTITFHIRKGVKFHDGTDFIAPVAAWNYRLFLEKGKIPNGEQISRVEVVDDYTMRLHLSSYNNQMLWDYGWVPMWSQAAFEKNGVEWCRKHIVGTGPFKQKEWKRGVFLKWERFEDYWQKGKPYLDGIEVRYIPDPVTASQLMQAGEADLWRSPPVREQHNLSQMGLVRKSYWPGMPSILYLNTKDPNAPTAKKKVREAIEYAIDKPAIAKAFGYGYYEPLYLFHPPGNWAHDPSYKPRTYNPEKARRLLSEAGYPNGCKLSLLAFDSYGGGKDTAEAIKQFLDDVGIEVEIDMSDLGRYFAAMFGTGWKDMLLSFNGTDPTSLATFEGWYGHHPRSHLGSFKAPDELLELSKTALGIKDVEEQKRITRKAAVMMADEALFIPLMHIPSAYLTQPWVHTNYLECGLGRWRTADIWMEKH